MSLTFGITFGDLTFGVAFGDEVAVSGYVPQAFANYKSYLRRVQPVSYSIGQGDLEPDLIIEAGVNGKREDLSDAISVTLRWWKPSGEYAEVLVTPLDLVAGTFLRTWAPGDTDEIGMHRARLRVIRGNGEPQTFPSDGSFVRWRIV